MDSYTDEHIIKGIKAGGKELEDVMRHLYNDDKLRKDIFSFIQSRGGVVEDAEDIFQDGIRSLIVNVRRDKFKGENPTRGYLFGVCRNLWFKKFNRNVRSENYKSSLKVEDRDEKDPESELVSQERAELLNKLLEQLGPKCKKVLELWKLSYSMKEIAEELGYKSEGVARKKKHQCFQGLVKIVKENPHLVKLLKNSPQK